MTCEETLKLIDAGFTADEIRKMESAPEGEPAGEPEGKPDGDNPKEAANETQKGDPNDVVAKLTAEITKLNETVSKMQETNLKNAKSGESSAGDPVKEQIDSFLKTL